METEIAEISNFRFNSSKIIEKPRSKTEKIVRKEVGKLMNIAVIKLISGYLQYFNNRKKRRQLTQTIIKLGKL